MSRPIAPLILLAVMCVTFPRDAAEAAEPIKWLNEKQLQEQLEQPFSGAWSKAPLRSALRKMSHAQRVAIVLDRHVDPQQKLDLVISNDPLGVALARIAEQQKLGLAIVGPVAYFGPKETAGKLRTLAALRHDEVRDSPSARKKFSASRPWHWDDLATPRELLAALAKEADVKLAGLEQIPHDLWTRGDLPALPWTDRMTLVAAQFDLTFEIDPQTATVTLTPIPERVTLSRSYPAGSGARGLMQRFARELPDAKIDVQGNNLVVETTAEDQDFIARALRGGSAKKTTVKPGKEVYTLTVKNEPLGGVLKQYGKMLSIDVQLDAPAIEKAGISLEQLISVKVDKVTLDELLKATLVSTGLEFERRERVVTIRPAKK